MSSKKHKQNSKFSIFFKAIVKSLSDLLARSAYFVCEICISSLRYFTIRMCHLTSQYKKSIIQTEFEDSKLFVWLRKRFRSIRKATVASSLKEFRFFYNLPKGRKDKVAIMVKNFLRARVIQDSNLLIRARAFVVIGVLAVSSFLVACGGGGGGSTTITTPVTPAPTPTAVTVVCPDGSSKTADTDTSAAALCALPTLVSITPTNGDLLASTDVIATSGIVVSTSSILQVPTSTNVTLKAGQTAIPGTVSMVSTKSFKFVPSTKLLYGQAYSFVANLKDSLGKPLVVSTTFTTSAVITCTSPAMQNSLGACISPPAATGYTWNNVIKAWVADVGTLVSGLNVLPDNCLYIGDACWKANVANGTIKFVNTGAVLTGTPAVGRPVVFALYVVGNVGFANGASGRAIVWADSPDMMSISNTVNESVTNMTVTERTLEFRGTKTGSLEKNSSNLCYSRDWVISLLGFQQSTTTCPI